MYAEYRGTADYQSANFIVTGGTVCPGADQRKHQSSTSLPFVGGTHRSPVDSPHKGPVTRKMFPFDDVIMIHPNNVDCDEAMQLYTTNT